MTVCKNCCTEFDSKFCPNCGTSALVSRIDKKYLWHELQHTLFHFEKGFFYTTKELIFKPGNTVKSFLEGNRAKHFKPIGYLIICSLFYSVISHKFEKKPEVLHHMKGNSGKIFEWITDHYNYSNLIEIFFIALALSLIFRKRQYGYFENVVLVSYLTGFAMFCGAFFILGSYFSKVEIINGAFPFVMVLYCMWGIAQFYNDGKIMTYVKSFFAYAIGFMFFVFLATTLGVVLDALGF